MHATSKTRRPPKRYLLLISVGDNCGFMIPQSTVWENSSGFSFRKNCNLPEDFKAYDKALSIDPKHLGAHEYLGEAYVINKEPEKARAELIKLKGICGNCEEARDLEKAIKSSYP